MLGGTRQRWSNTNSNALRTPQRQVHSPLSIKSKRRQWLLLLLLLADYVLLVHLLSELSKRARLVAAATAAFAVNCTSTAAGAAPLLLHLRQLVPSFASSYTRVVLTRETHHVLSQSYRVKEGRW